MQISKPSRSAGRQAGRRAGRPACARVLRIPRSPVDKFDCRCGSVCLFVCLSVCLYLCMYSSGPAHIHVRNHGELAVWLFRSEVEQISSRDHFKRSLFAITLNDHCLRSLFAITVSVGGSVRQAGSRAAGWHAGKQAEQPARRQASRAARSQQSVCGSVRPAGRQRGKQTSGPSSFDYRSAS